MEKDALTVGWTTVRGPERVSNIGFVEHRNGYVHVTQGYHGIFARLVQLRPAFLHLERQVRDGVQPASLGRWHILPV